MAAANAQPILDALRGPARDCPGVSLLIGALLLIVSLVTALRGTLVPRLVSDLSAAEVANYTSDRFLAEPDLWRVQVRALRGLLKAIEWTTRQGDEAARAVSGAENFFFAGLSAVGIALAILLVVVTL